MSRVTLAQFLARYESLEKQRSNLYALLVAKKILVNQTDASNERDKFVLKKQICRKRDRWRYSNFVQIDKRDCIKCFENKQWHVLRVLFANQDERKYQYSDVGAAMVTSQRWMLNHLFDSRKRQQRIELLADMLAADPELFARVGYQSVAIGAFKAGLSKDLAEAIKLIAHGEHHAAIGGLVTVVRKMRASACSAKLFSCISYALFDTTDKSVALRDGEFECAFLKESDSDSRGGVAIDELFFWIKQLNDHCIGSGFYADIHARVVDALKRVSSDDAMQLLLACSRDKDLKNGGAYEMLHNIMLPHLKKLVHQSAHNSALSQYCSCMIAASIYRSDNCVSTLRSLLSVYGKRIPPDLLDQLFDSAEELGQVDLLISEGDEVRSYFQTAVRAAFSRSGDLAPKKMFRHLLAARCYREQFFVFARRSHNKRFLSLRCLDAMSVVERTRFIVDIYAFAVQDRDASACYDMGQFVLDCLPRLRDAHCDGVSLVKQLLEINRSVADAKIALLLNQHIAVNYYRISGDTNIPIDLLKSLIDVKSTCGLMTDESIATLLVDALDCGDELTLNTLIDHYWSRLPLDSVADISSRLKRRMNASSFMLFALLQPISFKSKSRLIALSRNLRCVDREGRTPLHIAIETGQHGLVYELLKYSQVLASLNERDADGNTPLSLAITRNDMDAVLHLLDAGVAYGAGEINCRQVFGEDASTVLHLAVKLDSEDVLRALLQYKDIRKLINTADNNGLSPLGLACQSSKMGCAKLLLQAGARPGKVVANSWSDRLLNSVASSLGVHNPGHKTAGRAALKAGCSKELKRLKDSVKSNAIPKLYAIDDDVAARDMRRMLGSAMQHLSYQLASHDHTRARESIRVAISTALNQLRQLPMINPGQLKHDINRVIQTLANNTYEIEGDRRHSYLSSVVRRSFENDGYAFENVAMSFADRFVKVARDELSAVVRFFGDDPENEQCLTLASPVFDPMSDVADAQAAEPCVFEGYAVSYANKVEAVAVSGYNYPDQASGIGAASRYATPVAIESGFEECPPVQNEDKIADAAKTANYGTAVPVVPPGSDSGVELDSVPVSSATAEASAPPVADDAQRDAPVKDAAGPADVVVDNGSVASGAAKQLLGVGMFKLPQVPDHEPVIQEQENPKSRICVPN